MAPVQLAKARVAFTAWLVGCSMARADEETLGVDLGFEEPELRGWTRRESPDFDARLVSESCHGGRQCLRIAVKRGDGLVRAVVPAEKLRGKRMRVHYAVRTEACGYAAVMIRAQAGDRVLAKEASNALAASGTQPWSVRDVELAIPAEADSVFFGPFVAEHGTAWFDDLRIEILPPYSEAELQAAVPLVGVVLDDRGQPCAGAVVSALRAGHEYPAVGSTLTDERGAFRLQVPSGRYGVVATASAGISRKEETVVRPGREPAPLSLRIAPGAHTLSGRVAPVTSQTAVYVWDDIDGERLTVLTVDGEGRFEARLPASGYVLEAKAPGYLDGWAYVALDGDREQVIMQSPLSLLDAAPPREVVEWIQRRAVRLETTEPGAIDDLSGLHRMIGGARIVSMGEASHGTREFFQLKQRVFQYLVEKEGFTVFAIEGNFPESEAADDYVLRGEGDAVAALRAMYFWTWDTEEVRDLLEWMRAYNADPRHRRKLRFYGIDSQTAAGAVARVARFLGVPADALAPLAERHYADQPAEVQRAVRQTLGEWRARLDRMPSSPQAKMARHALETAAAAEALKSPPPGDNAIDARERVMAANVRWVAEVAEPGAKVMVWAHNGHVMTSPYHAAPAMGIYLKRMFGARLVTVGFAFGEGRLRSVGVADHRLDAWQAPRAPSGSLEGAMAAAGIPLFVIDLRTATGAARTWVETPQVMHNYSELFLGPEYARGQIIPRQAFDAIIYVDRTTPSRPNPRH